MSVLDAHTNDLGAARERLVAELREHALVIGRVRLTSGREADYYVDAKRAILRPAGFAALGRCCSRLSWRSGTRRRSAA